MATAFCVLLLTLPAPADVTIDSDSITLGALIAFPPGDPRAAISLGNAPNPGVARRVTKSEILNKIGLAGKSSDDLQLPESILVHRRAAGLNRDQVMQAILEAFIQRFPGANVEIGSVEIPSVQLGTGAVEITATLPSKLDPAAAVFARVDLRGPAFLKTVFVRTNVRIETEQPVLKNKVAAHTEVQPADIERRMMPLRSSSSGPGEIDGMVAKRDLEPGQILTSDLLYVPLLVRRGDSVTVKASAGAITIAASMRARSGGKLGDTIVVEHPTGEGTTMARIVGPRTLEVSK